MVAQNSEVTKALSEKIDTAFDITKDIRRDLDGIKEKIEYTSEISSQQYEWSKELLTWVSGYVAVFLILISFYEVFTRERNRKQQSEVHEKNIEALGSQIENLSKVGELINLITSSFDLQHKAYEQQASWKDEIDKNKRRKHLRLTKFKKLYDDLQPFTKMSRLEWPSISHEQQLQIQESIGRFERIDDDLGIEEEFETDLKVPHTCYLLGVGAFYRNDINTALNYFQRSISLYDLHGSGFDNLKSTEHRFPYIYNHHFLGLIEKNWHRENVPLEANIEKSKASFERVHKWLADKEGELLTPITYAEVLSYMPGERTMSKGVLESAIKKMEILKNGGKTFSKNNVNNLDKNQIALLSRAYLILGNLAFLNKHDDDAAEMYAKAIDLMDSNYYAWFSKAMISSKLNKKDWEAEYASGLERMNKAGVINKPEITTRGTILAWAVIASYKIDAPQKYEYHSSFNELIEKSRPIGERKPMFFCPISKMLEEHSELKKSVESEI